MLLLFSKYVPITRTDQLPEMGPVFGTNSVTVAKLIMLKGSDDEARPPIRTTTDATPNTNGGVVHTTKPLASLKST